MTYSFSNLNVEYIRPLDNEFMKIEAIPLINLILMIRLVCDRCRWQNYTEEVKILVVGAFLYLKTIHHCSNKTPKKYKPSTGNASILLSDLLLS